MTIKRDLTFRGDFDAVSDLMKQSWSRNADQSLLYGPTFLANSFTYPGASLEMAVAVYKNSRPVAFVAGFPRTIRLHGRTLRVILNTFLTVAPEYQGKAYGAAVWSELAIRARDAGYDGTINFCVDGGPTNAIVQICGLRLGYATERIFSTTYMACLLSASSPRSTTCIPDISRFMDLAAGVEAPLARVWTAPEAGWQCSSRHGAIYAMHGEGPGHGILTGYVMDSIGGPKALLVEDLLWGTLDAAGRARLLSEFLATGAHGGAAVAVVGKMGYADEQPLLDAGFRRIRRRVHTYLTLWNGITCGPVGSHYIDVF